VRRAKPAILAAMSGMEGNTAATTTPCATVAPARRPYNKWQKNPTPQDALSGGYLSAARLAAFSGIKEVQDNGVVLDVLASTPRLKRPYIQRSKQLPAGEGIVAATASPMQGPPKRRGQGPRVQERMVDEVVHDAMQFTPPVIRSQGLRIDRPRNLRCVLQLFGEHA
jgi:hypothetical protein